MTIPIDRAALVVGGRAWPANGMSSCAPTDVTPTTTSAIAMTGNDGASAVQVSATAATTSTRGT